jgi:hypothetical protein
MGSEPDSYFIRTQTAKENQNLKRLTLSLTTLLTARFIIVGNSQKHEARVASKPCPALLNFKSNGEEGSSPCSAHCAAIVDVKMLGREASWRLSGLIFEDVHSRMQSLLEPKEQIKNKPFECNNIITPRRQNSRSSRAGNSTDKKYGGRCCKLPPTKLMSCTVTTSRASLRSIIETSYLGKQHF